LRYLRDIIFPQEIVNAIINSINYSINFHHVKNIRKEGKEILSHPVGKYLDLDFLYSRLVPSNFGEYMIF